MLKSSIKSMIRRSVLVVRSSPILLSTTKWLLTYSGPINGLVRSLVDKSMAKRPSTNLSKLTATELRVYVDLQRSIEVFGKSKK